MNPYFQLLLDIVALLETPQFAQVIADIQAAEGGSGARITSPGASNAVRQAIQHAAAKPTPAQPVTAPGAVKVGLSKIQR